MFYWYHNGEWCVDLWLLSFHFHTQFVLECTQTLTVQYWKTNSRYCEGNPSLWKYVTMTWCRILVESWACLIQSTIHPVAFWEYLEVPLTHVKVTRRVVMITNILYSHNEHMTRYLFSIVKIGRKEIEREEWIGDILGRVPLGRLLNIPVDCILLQVITFCICAKCIVSVLNLTTRTPTL